MQPVKQETVQKFDPKRIWDADTKRSKHIGKLARDLVIYKRPKY